MPGIWVLAEVKDGKIRKVALEILSKAKELASTTGEEVAAVLLGKSVKNLSSTLAQYGAAKVFVAQDDKLEPYTPEAYADVLSGLIQQHSPSIFLSGATSMGKELMPRLAQRCSAGLASDCTNLEIADGNLAATRPVYSGKVYLKVAVVSKPGFATIRPNAFMPSAPNSSSAEVVEVKVPENLEVKSAVKEVIQTGGSRPELTEADIIVTGGRGIKGPENYHLIEMLADALGGAVGASRAVVDAGWRPHSEQVGQTGKTVSPNLYFAFGVSGAIQHLAGMASSKYIVAINKDPDAPIFKIASYGVVGDLFEVVPALTEEVKKLKEQG